VKFGAENIPQQHRGDLGVRLGLEGVTLGYQLQLELGEVLDDAVVDQGQLAAVGQVRVRVLVRGAAVRSPAGVADTGERLRQRVLLQFGEEIDQLAGLLPGLDGPLGDHRHPRRVITPVLQAAQSLKDNIQRTVTGIPTASRMAHISNDSTHGFQLIGSRVEI